MVKTLCLWTISKVIESQKLARFSDPFLLEINQMLLKKFATIAFFFIRLRWQQTMNQFIFAVFNIRTQCCSIFR